MRKEDDEEEQLELPLVQKQAQANSPQGFPLRPKFCIGACSICPYCREERR